MNVMRCHIMIFMRYRYNIDYNQLITNLFKYKLNVYIYITFKLILNSYVPLYVGIDGIPIGYI